MRHRAEISAFHEKMAILDSHAAELRREIAMTSDMPDWTPDQREAALLRSLEHLQDLHGWVLSVDPRGVRLTHGAHTCVLGIAPIVRAFLDAPT